MGKSKKKCDDKCVAVKASGVGTKAKKGSDNIAPSKMKMLQALLQPYKFGKPVDNEEFSKLYGCHVRTKTYVALKNDVEQEGLLEKVGNKYILTEKGAAAAGYVKKELDPSQYDNNEEYHEYIKSTLTPKWKGAEIMDLLKTRGQMTRKELCETIGVKSGTHSFSYGLKEVKDFGLVALVDGSSKKLALTKKAYIAGKEETQKVETMNEETMNDETMKVETMKEDTVKEETMQEETVEEETVEEETMNVETAKEETAKEGIVKEESKDETTKEKTVKEETIKEEMTKEDVTMEDTKTKEDTTKNETAVEDTAMEDTTKDETTTEETTETKADTTSEETTTTKEDTMKE